MLRNTSSIRTKLKILSRNIEGTIFFDVRANGWYNVWHLLLYGVYFMMPGMDGSFAVRTCVISVVWSFVYGVGE